MFPFPSPLLMLNATSGGSGGNIAFVGSAPPVGAINGGSVTVNFSNLRDSSGNPVTLLQNDIVVCAFNDAVGLDFAMVTPTGYTEIAQLYSNSVGTGQDTNLAAYYKIMGATPDTSVTFTGSGGSTVSTIAAVMVFRGVNTTTPLDVAATTATGTGGSQPNPPAITPTTAGSWIVVVGGAGAISGAAYTNPGDLSSATNQFVSSFSDDSNDAIIGMGIKTNWASGSFDPSQWSGGGTNVAGDSWAAVTIALRSA